MPSTSYLLRVSKSRLLEQEAYQYYAGSDAASCDKSTVKWSTNSNDASPVLSAGVGELSVSWLPKEQSWLASYTAPLSRVQARTSQCLWHHWSSAVDVATQASVHDLVYGGFQLPTLSTSEAVYMTISKWNAYEAYLLKVNRSQLFSG